MPLRFEGESVGKEAYTRVVELTEAKQTFRFLGVVGRPVLSINRSFSAPIRLETTYSDEDLAFLMASDPDRFNRWEAGQRYATRLLLKMVEEARAGREPETDSRFVDAIHAGLREEDPDRTFMAQMLVLPSEDYLAEQMATADPEAIHKAREALRRSIATRLTHDLLVIHRGNRSNRAYVFEIGRASCRERVSQYVYITVVAG